MFDVIQIIDFTFNFDELDVPGCIDLINAPTKVFDAFNRIIPNDQLNRERIVSVDPIGQLFISAPELFVWMVVA